jgi:hypothetical protein
LICTASERKKTIFWEYGRNDSSFAYPKGADRSPNIALREGKWRFLMNANKTSRQLYNIESDPDETQNLYLSQHQVAAKLEEKLMAWRRSLPRFN